MKLPWTPKPRTASLEELREQLENAKATHVAAQTATHSAQVAFDDAGDTTAEKALLAARAAEQSASEHLARAERLAAAAEDKRKAEERAELELEAAEIQAELAGVDPMEQRLLSEEVAAYEAVVKVRVARQANNQARVLRRHRLENIRAALGHETRALYAHEFNAEPSHFEVSERLKALAAGIPSSEPRARYFDALARLNFQ